MVAPINIASLTACRHCPPASSKLLTLDGAAIDVALWIVGGLYGTPRCAEGCSHNWMCSGCDSIRKDTHGTAVPLRARRNVALQMLT
ncbi:uncharacterized protein CC84DRAFT_1161069 [Paraphaeosphaeria sporulosa]|uniref:Uncharacterized protein n=1 Tax=Paraphaeosphaeria sporulosa TaxID=1460663 RepID=A0A177CS88_9PLEO|nr:uncharacterized protein CC84DRAFT_1161069 [Paraphaeosphaeria sporulosa]OAG10061.1 hypothetical protein CC84DRAFT_1161069 [Paraphaeosphaeria sporulosa]